MNETREKEEDRMVRGVRLTPLSVARVVGPDATLQPDALPEDKSVTDVDG